MTSQVQPVLELSLHMLRVTWFIEKGSKFFSFTCARWLAGKWQNLPDSTYKTLLPIDTESEVLLAAAQRVLNVLEDKGIGYVTNVKAENYSSDLELLSWISPDNFTLRYKLEEVV